jgi:hypothetical protein
MKCTGPRSSRSSRSSPRSGTPRASPDFGRPRGVGLLVSERRHATYIVSIILTTTRSDRLGVLRNSPFYADVFRVQFQATCALRVRIRIGCTCGVRAIYTSPSAYVKSKSSPRAGRPASSTAKAAARGGASPLSRLLRRALSALRVIATCTWPGDSFESRFDRSQSSLVHYGGTA